MVLAITAIGLCVRPLGLVALGGSVGEGFGVVCVCVCKTQLLDYYV